MMGGSRGLPTNLKNGVIAQVRTGVFLRCMILLINSGSRKPKLEFPKLVFNNYLMHVSPCFCDGAKDVSRFCYRPLLPFTARPAVYLDLHLASVSRGCFRMPQTQCADFNVSPM